MRVLSKKPWHINFSVRIVPLSTRYFDISNAVSILYKGSNEFRYFPHWYLDIYSANYSENQGLQIDFWTAGLGFFCELVGHMRKLEKRKFCAHFLNFFWSRFLVFGAIKSTILENACNTMYYCLKILFKSFLYHTVSWCLRSLQILISAKTSLKRSLISDVRIIWSPISQSRCKIFCDLSRDFPSLNEVMKYGDKS